MNELKCERNVLQTITEGLESEKSEIGTADLPESVEKKFLEIGKKLSESSLDISHICVLIDMDFGVFEYIELKFRVGALRWSINFAENKVDFVIYKRMSDCLFTHILSSSDGDKIDDADALTQEEVVVVDMLVSILREIKVKSESIVICGFPGVGKSYLHNLYPDLTINLDCNVIVDDRTFRHFPPDYVSHIKEVLEANPTGKIILVSSSSSVREELNGYGIKYALVHPARHLKECYLARYRERGDDGQYIKTMDDNWDSFIDSCESNCKSIRVEQVQETDYLINALRSIFLANVLLANSTADKQKEM